MQVIAQYSKPEEAYLAASALEGNGISAEVRDDNIVSLYWLYSNAVGGVKVAVSEADVTDAKAILNLSNTESGFIACPACGSGHTHVRDLNPVSAVCLALFGMPIPLGKHVFDCLDCSHSFSP